MAKQQMPGQMSISFDTRSIDEKTLPFERSHDARLFYVKIHFVARTTMAVRIVEGKGQSVERILARLTKNFGDWWEVDTTNVRSSTPYQIKVGSLDWVHGREPEAWSGYVYVSGGGLCTQTS